MIFILFRGLEFWSVDHTSIKENSESNGFTNIKCVGEISSIDQTIY